jgi:hypothetical protein
MPYPKHCFPPVREQLTSRSPANGSDLSSTGLDVVRDFAFFGPHWQQDRPRSRSSECSQYAYQADVSLLLAILGNAEDCTPEEIADMFEVPGGVEVVKRILAFAARTGKAP